MDHSTAGGPIEAGRCEQMNQDLNISRWLTISVGTLVLMTAYAATLLGVKYLLL